MVLLLFITGLAVLVLGAEALVRGSSRLAAALGISPLVIGLTVVAFGTSAPELAVSLKSAFAGQPGLAIGNVVGSNIFNILFILGLSALITPLIVSQQLIKIDVPMMIVVSVLMLVFGLDGTFSRIEGIVLFSGLAAYILFLIRQSRKESSKIAEEYAREYGAGGEAGLRDHLKNIFLVVLGLVLLTLGSRWLVDSAVNMARFLGVSDLIIGLTMIAFGTSLPEAVTSVIASIRGERDIAVGNLIGSNLFNIMCVLALSGIAAPAGIAVSRAALSFDIPVMIAVAVACLPIFFTNGMIARWEGGLLLGYYGAYTLYLFLNATRHSLLSTFNAGMLYFVIPITVLTLIVITIQVIRSGNKPPRPAA